MSPKAFGKGRRLIIPTTVRRRVCRTMCRVPSQLSWFAANRFDFWVRRRKASPQSSRVNLRGRGQFVSHVQSSGLGELVLNEAAPHLVGLPDRVQIPLSLGRGKVFLHNGV